MRALAISLALAVVTSALPAPAQDPCRPRELSDIVEEMEAEMGDKAPEPLSTPPPGIAIVYDGTTWSGLASSGSSLQQVLHRALMEMRSPDTAPNDCARRYPFADTVFLRHPGIFPRLPEADRNRFVAAEIARSTPIVFEILDDLTGEDAAPLTRYRALLEMLNRSQRAPDGLEDGDLKVLLDQAWTSLPAAAAIMSVSDIAPEADLHYIAARLCLADGQGAATCIAHLDAALAADPWFSGARQMRIELLDQLIRSVRHAEAARCGQLQSLLVVDIDNLLEGLEDRRARVDLGLSLDASAGTNNPVLLLGASHALREGGATHLADAALAEIEIALESDHPCNPLLREALDGLQ